MKGLGKIERVDDLRTIWAHEAHDFTKWLAEDDNLEMLSEAIGIDIVLEETESSVGNFNVDIYASEEGTSRKIIIENQLEDTNHDHLGKIITYASGKNAEVIVWIVKRARNEHRQAIEWLNQHTDENIGFFLVEIELWKIDNSLPAVKFNVVEQPNEWTKTLKSSEELSDLKRTNYEYWDAFTKYASSKPEFTKQFSFRKVNPQQWYDLSVGNRNCHISLTASMTKGRRAAQIYISRNKELFNHFKEHKDEIEKLAGEELRWHEASVASVVGFDYYDADYDRANWDTYFEWYCDCALKLKKIVQKFAD